jgi:hypothetical protein
VNINLKPAALGIACLLISTISIGQQQAKLALSADSLATGNYKDVLKSFFQLAFNRFTSKDKELQFSSNPFAVMAKLDSTLLIDTNYFRYTHLRNLNFAFGARLDSSYRFNGFSSGIKYAIVNKRDETVSQEFAKAAYQANDEYNKLTIGIGAFVAALDRNDSRRTLYISQYNSLLNDTTFKLSQVDKDFQKIIRHVADSLKLEGFLALSNDKNLIIRKVQRQTYDSLREIFQKGLLWTVGITDTTYKDQFFFSNVDLNTELVKGIGKAKPGSNWELNIKAGVNWVDDTLAAGRDLRRNIFSFEPGLNWVFRTKNTLKSFFEFKFSGSYYHIFNGIYKDESDNKITVNGTLRIRIINDIWVPLEIKYDPKTGNVFGFLNVRANFQGLRNLIKPS